MKKIISILVLLSLVLSSCGKEEIVKVVEKKDFLIEAKDFSEFSKETNLEKVGKISSSQNIKVSSNATGRVKGVYVREGELVKKGDILAVLDDNIASYGINLERASNALEKTKINYEQTENSLNKTISDLKINLNNLKIDEFNSFSSLQLEKIENTIKKLELDYQNLQASNLQTIEGFNQSLQKELNSYKTFLVDVIDFSDKLLGVTYENRDYSRSFKNLIGAKNSAQKQGSEELLKQLISYKNLNNLYNVTLNIDNIDNYLDFITTGYKKAETMLNSLEITLNNSIESVGVFSSSDIMSNKATVNSYQSTLTMNNSTFISIKNSINTFLETYKNNENSLFKQIILLKNDKKIYINSLDTNVTLSESTLNEAISNKTLTLRNLNRLIVDAEIAYKEALKQYNKLNIKAPISGTIGEIFIDIGQEISNGTPTFSILNSSSNEVIVSFNKNELDFINEGMSVNIEYEGEKYAGYIYSISKIADSNLKYISTIKITSDIDLIGNIVSVIVPIKINYVLLPLNIVKVRDLNIGEINILKDGRIDQIDIKVGKIYGDKIETYDVLGDDFKIITTFVDNYDPEKFNLKIK